MRRESAEWKTGGTVGIGLSQTRGPFSYNLEPTPASFSPWVGWAQSTLLLGRGVYTSYCSNRCKTVPRPGLLQPGYPPHPPS